MSNKFFYFLIILFTCTSATSQSIELPTEYIRNNLSGRNNPDINVTGSKYLNENFQPATINIDDKSFKSMVRYNGLQDEFELIDSEGQIVILSRRPSIQVVMGGSRYKIYSYKDENGIIKQVYFKELYDGGIMLLKRTGITLKPAQKAANHYSMDVPASFEPFTDYYVKEKEGQPATKIKLNKKNVLNYFDNPAIKSYVKKNGMKFKDEAELIELIAFYDKQFSN